MLARFELDPHSHKDIHLIERVKCLVLNLFKVSGMLHIMTA